MASKIRHEVFEISQPEASQTAIQLDASIYVPQGLSQNNRIVLFLPFWGGTNQTYRTVQEMLADKCSEIPSMALSYRGTGQSSPPSPDVPEAHSTKVLASDIVAILKSSKFKTVFNTNQNSPKKVISCAHSMSAKVVPIFEMLLASDADCKHITGNSALLLSPAPPGPLSLPPEIRQGQLTAYNDEQSARWTIDNVLTHRKLDEQVKKTLIEGCIGYSEGAKKGWIEIGMQESILDVVNSFQPSGGSSDIVRVLVGEHDKVEPKESAEEETVRYLTSLKFNCSLRIVEDCGHLIPLERPDIVVEEMNELIRSSVVLDH